MASTCADQLAPRRFFHLHNGGLSAELKHLLGGRRCKQMHGAGNNAGPAGLMARAEAGAIITMEILVKQDQVAPVRVFLKLPRAAVYRPPAIPVPEEDVH